MPQHYFIQIDPQRIRLNPLNPRKHRGTEYVRLKESIEQLGIIQPPIVRVLPGNFYEVIDGEGRVSIAQELGFADIWVISVGIVDDHDALVMLQASNTLRSFNFLAECKGLANLYRRKMAHRELAKQFGCSVTKIVDMVGIGHFPEQTLLTIEENIMVSEEQAGIWTYFLLHQLLPLRELLPGRSVSHGSTWYPLDDLYDYREVNTAIEEVICGKITGGEQMHTYVVNRRYEIYQARFDQDLHQKLEQELTTARQELEAAKAQHLRDVEQERDQRVHAVEEQTRLQYEGQITILQSQLDTLSKRHREVVREVAKRPEVVKAREYELSGEIERTQREREELRNLRQQLQHEASQAQEEMRKVQAEARQEAQKIKAQLEKEIKKKFDEEMEKQRKAQEHELKRAEDVLRELYMRKSQDQQIKAENTIQGLLSHGVKRLAEAQQAIDHIVSPSMIDGVRQLGGAQYESLLWAIRSMSEALDRAERKLTYDEVLHVEGGSVNGYK